MDILIFITTATKLKMYLKVKSKKDLSCSLFTFLFQKCK